MHEAAPAPEGAGALPTLLLGTFGGVPWVDFGVVPKPAPGAHSAAAPAPISRVLLLENPEDRPVTVTIDKAPATGVFALAPGAAAGGSIVVPPRGRVPLALQWTPDGPGNARDAITFRVNGRHRVTANLFGAATVVSARRGAGVAAVSGHAEQQPSPTPSPAAHLPTLSHSPHPRIQPRRRPRTQLSAARRARAPPRAVRAPPCASGAPTRREPRPLAAAAAAAAGPSPL
jgi:hypothetical protein